MAIVFSIQSSIFDHPWVKYYIKAIKITRPVSVASKNVMDITTSKSLIQLVVKFRDGVALRAMFLVRYFTFFKLSNLVPHAIQEFYPSCTLQGMTFSLENQTLTAGKMDQNHPVQGSGVSH